LKTSNGESRSGVRIPQLPQNLGTPTQDFFLEDYPSR
jgi:hypothetical protein